VAGLYRVDVKISTPEPVLSREMLQRLMPACFTVQAVRGLPNELWLSQKCEDVFVEVYPKMSKVTACLAKEFARTRTGCRSHNSMIRFDEPIVWLLGLAPPHVVREWLLHEGLLVEVHDRTLVGPPAEPRATEAEGDADPHAKLAGTLDRLGHDGVRKEHPHGVAQFNLGQLLRNNAMQVSLRSDVVPSRSDKKVRRAEMMKDPLRAKGLLEPEGIQNVETRSKVDKREDTTRFHPDLAMSATCKPTHGGTVCTIKAELAVPIPEKEHIEVADKNRKWQEWASGEQRQGASNIWAVTDACRVKLDMGGEQITGPWRKRQEDAEADEQRLTEALGEDGHDIEAVQAVASDLLTLGEQEFSHRYERYGRMVLVLRAGETESIKAVLQTFKDWNGKVLGLPPDGAELATYVLSGEERRDDKPLDIVTGFGVIDGYNRIIVVEGLRDSGLLEVLKAVPRDARPNSEEFKLLHHPGIGYSKRLYADFGPKLKQVKIRLQLEKLAAKPELYSQMGTESSDTIDGMHCAKLLMDLKHMRNLKSLRQGGNFPKATHLTNLEILFGGYVTDEELAGGMYSDPKRRSQVMKAFKGVHATTRMANLMRSSSEAETAKAAAATLRKSEDARKRAALDMTNTNYTATVDMRKSQSVPDFRRTNKDMVRQQSEAVEKLNDLMGKKRERQTPFLDGQEVYLYSGQKLNSAELQKDWMRKHIDQHEKDKIWTYCPAYSSCNFEFSGAEPPGLKGHTARCPNDSYANQPGDDRDPFRIVQSRPAEEFKKMDHRAGVDEGRLGEQFVEGEFFQWKAGEHRHKPIGAHVEFEPERIPHHRTVTEQPFDRAQITKKGDDFGPRCLFESVHYHGRAPGEDRYEEATKHNLKGRELAESKILFHKSMRAFNKSSTRHGITDLDRHEPTIKDEPHKKLGTTISMPKATIRIHEEFHDNGRPDLEWQARLRENDGSPPYEVNTGTYLKRDMEVGTGTKRSCMNGTVGKAPWRHFTGLETATKDSLEYPCQHDFNLTRQPPKSRQCENQLWKNASRTSISTHERTDHRAYKRPQHFGVSLSQT